MNINIKKLKIYTYVVVLPIYFVLSTTLYAVVFPSKKPATYTTDIKDLKPSLKLDTKDTTRNIMISSDMLKTRIKKSPSNPEIEAVELKVPKDKKERLIFAGRLAKDGLESLVLKHLNKKVALILKHDHSQDKNQSFVKVEVDSYLARIIKLSLFSKDYEASTHDLVIKTKNLSTKLKKQLVNQVE